MRWCLRSERQARTLMRANSVKRMSRAADMPSMVTAWVTISSFCAVISAGVAPTARTYTVGALDLHQLLHPGAELLDGGLGHEDQQRRGNLVVVRGVKLGARGDEEGDDAAEERERRVRVERGGAHHGDGAREGGADEAVGTVDQGLALQQAYLAAYGGLECVWEARKRVGAVRNRQGTYPGWTHGTDHRWHACSTPPPPQRAPPPPSVAPV